MSIRPSWWLALLALSACGGSDDKTTPDEADADADADTDADADADTDTDTTPTGDTGLEPLVVGELTAVIGASGGVIDGAGELGFEGLRIEFPAGALDADTTVVVRQVSIDQPLPTLGEQCGQSYEIDGGGAVLSAPIEVILPVDPGVVGDYGQTAGDVRVWFLPAGSWETVTPTGTAEGSVTFEVSDFGAAAAGVRRQTLPDLCLVGTTCATVTTSPTPPLACPGPAYCVAPLGAAALPTPESGTRLYTDYDGQLHYLTRPAPNQVAAVRVSSSGAAATSLPYTTTSTTRYNLTAARFKGETWVGIGTGGNVRFKFDGSAPAVFDSDGVGMGGVSYDDGTFSRFSSRGISTRQLQDPSFEARTMGTFVTVSVRHANAGPAFGRQAVFSPDAVTEVVSEFLPNPNNPTSSFVATHAPGDRTIGRPTLGIASTGESFAVFPQSTNPRLVVMRESDGVLEQVTGVPKTLDAVVDTNGDVFLVASETPELVLIRNILDAGNRSVELIPLTTATSGTNEFTNTLPRGIGRLPDGRIVVHTLDGRLLGVRRPGT
jgi:hypothetical protein